jgi:hypothetical protein
MMINELRALSENRKEKPNYLEKLPPNTPLFTTKPT